MTTDLLDVRPSIKWSLITFDDISLRKFSSGLKKNPKEFFVILFDTKNAKPFLTIFLSLEFSESKTFASE